MNHKHLVAEETKSYDKQHTFLGEVFAVTRQYVGRQYHFIGHCTNRTFLTAPNVPSFQRNVCSGELVQFLAIVVFFLPFFFVFSIGDYFSTQYPKTTLVIE